MVFAPLKHGGAVVSAGDLEAEVPASSLQFLRRNLRGAAREAARGEYADCDLRSELVDGARVRLAVRGENVRVRVQEGRRSATVADTTVKELVAEIRAVTNPE